jgi:DNA repair protein SbcC/Rad50
MKLSSLQIKNFRCFDEVNLDLNLDGLIGVVGPNGAGKSSLFAAVEWVLYGSERGAGALPAHRDGTEPKDCKVTLEFLLGEQRLRATRTPSNAELRLLDTDTVLASGLTATSAEVARTLAMSRESFLSTFYARQREVQALDPRDASRRRGQLERLLGIERNRRAAELARAEAREQELTVKAHSEEQDDPKLALDRLRESEDLARTRAPAVEQAHRHAASAGAARERARERLQNAHTKATVSHDAKARAELAAAQAAGAAREAERTSKAAAQAREAATRAQQLTPIAARVQELRAGDRELELRRQASEHARALRARWEEAQRSASTLAERLAEKPDERGELSRLQSEQAEVAEILQPNAARSLQTMRRLSELQAGEREAERLLASAERHAALTAQLADEPEVRAQAKQAAQTLTDAKAQILQSERHIAEEQENLQSIREDGPDAHCLRCRRPYGADFAEIVHGIEASVGELTSGLERMRATAKQAGAARVAADNRLAELGALSRERDGLTPPRALDELREAADLARRRRQSTETESEQLQAARESAEQRAATLKGQIEPLATRVSAWSALAGELESAAHDAELLAREMTSTPAQDYDPDAHAALRAELTAAADAERELSTLTALAGQRELLDARAAEASSVAAAAQQTHETLLAQAKQVHVDPKALAAATEEDRAAEQASTDALQALHAAEQQAIREDDAVKAAREALDRARRGSRRLRAEKQELAIRKRVQDLLEAYRMHRSQHALPALESDTAALLARITRGRYSDVSISAEGYALQITEEGTAHSLRRFSGGEQDITNLCLRLALSRILSRQRAADTGFVILDEVLGSQDPDRRSSLMEELRALTDEFGQVFVVSHFTDIAEKCDIQLHLARPNPPAPAIVTQS